MRSQETVTLFIDDAIGDGSQAVGRGEDALAVLRADSWSLDLVEHPERGRSRAQSLSTSSRVGVSGGIEDRGGHRVHALALTHGTGRKPAMEVVGYTQQQLSHACR
jgi:hypothetical protein